MEQKSFLKVLVLLVLFCGIIQANNVVKGYVYDGETGFPVPGVQVFLSDSSKGVTTDYSGFFELSGIKDYAGITLQHIKYYQQNRELDFKNKNQIVTSYYLYSKTLEIDSVVVWGEAFFPGRNEVNFNKVQTKLYNDGYKQYLQMLKRKNWSWEELITYGLWTILTEDDFNNYWNLKGRSNREQFLQNFWKNNDPTPYTPINEFRDEFERRIRYNWTYFALNDSSGIAVKPDQFQTLLDTIIGANSFKHESHDRFRPWSKRAPWDARGELYLKYGAPTVRSLSDQDTDIEMIQSGGRNEQGISEKRHTRAWLSSTVEDDYEYWYYKDLDLDFNIHQYYTNIYKKAISPGQRSYNSLRIHSGNSEPMVLLHEEEFYKEFIENKIFYYDPKEEPKEIENIDLTVNISEKDKQMTLINLTFTPEYFKSVKTSDYYGLVSIKFEIIDLENPILKMTKTIDNIQPQTEAQDELFTYSLPIALDNGKYKVSLQVEDHNAYKTKSVEKEFTVENINL